MQGQQEPPEPGVLDSFAALRLWLTLTLDGKNKWGARAAAAPAC
jgi:hypothetical protein